MTGNASAQSFSLKTIEAGLGELSNLNGVAVADYDQDGDLDIYFVNYLEHLSELDHTWSRLYRNNGDKTFSDVTIASGLTTRTVQGYAKRIMGNQFGAAWGDYDNDGYPDLLLTNVGSEILYRNNGDGTFSDVTDLAGIGGPGDEDDIFESSSAVWWDYDSDGDLDLHIGSWSGFNRMYENLSDGTFLDVSEASGLKDDARTWTAVPIDVNIDGNLDLYLVNDFGPNRLYVNNGDKTFSDETAARGVGDRGNGMGVTVEDYNNDGFFDIYLTNIYDNGLEWNPLYTNDGTGHYLDESIRLGIENADWAWGTEWFDADNDGDLDLYVVNGWSITKHPEYDATNTENRLFVNRLANTGTLSFIDASVTAGVNGRAEARSLITFDYDNDGDLDILVANYKQSPLPDVNDSWPYLFENTSPTKNWIKLDLEGTDSNRNGFGATIKVVTGQRMQFRHNDGVGFLSQSIRPIHVGLESATIADEIQVFWPSGRVDSYYNVPANQTIHLLEGQGIHTNNENVVSIPFSRLPEIVSVYPNPLSDRVNIEFVASRGGMASLEIFNILGQRVDYTEIYFARPGQNQITKGLGDLPPGVYYFRVWTGFGAERTASGVHPLVKL